MNLNSLPSPPNLEKITTSENVSHSWGQWFFLLRQAITSAISAAQIAIQFKGNGVNQGSSGAITSVDFTGDGISATAVGTSLTVTVSQMTFNKIKAYAARH